MNTNDYIIRLERTEDYREVENLVRESFWNVYRPGCSEHYVLHVLRDDPAFIKELDFVMEQDDRLIGQNMFMKTIIEADDGKVIPVLTMGRLASLQNSNARVMERCCLLTLWRRRPDSAMALFCLKAISDSTASAALLMPVSLVSATMTCRKARMTPFSSARN